MKTDFEDLNGTYREGNGILYQNLELPKQEITYRQVRNTGALGAYTKAQMLSIVNKGLMPYQVEVGKTPIIYLAYRKKE